MKNGIQYIKTFSVFLILFFFIKISYGQGLIIDHSCTKLSNIPSEWIDSAKIKLHIAYQHTSHGSQLITGMQGLTAWKGNQYSFSNAGNNGALDLHDYAMSSYGASDLGSPDRTSWASATYNFLKENSDVNVIIWSWCGQVSSADSNDIETYIDLMTALEDSFPSVRFVYMTGYLDGSGLTGNLNLRNEQIRRYCRGNNKILFDFADIESYDPDGFYYMDKRANDNCDYDSDANGSLNQNWATDWQNSHTENIDWFNCSAAHSQALNGNLKAYAAWWLWASLAGWNAPLNIEQNDIKSYSFKLDQNYPNPFNPKTKIKFSIPVVETHRDASLLVVLKVYNVIGKEVATLINEEKTSGIYEIEFDASDLSSGIYFYKIAVGNYYETKKMLLLK